MENIVEGRLTAIPKVENLYLVKCGDIKEAGYVGSFSYFPQEKAWAFFVSEEGCIEEQDLLSLAKLVQRIRTQRGQV